MGRLNLKRAYSEPGPDDGIRILVDRLWPRGLGKEQARIDWWLKEIAPSTALRKWFGHDPERFAAFRDQYREELDGNPGPVAALCDRLCGHDATLIYAAHDPLCNQARVLAEYLAERGCVPSGR